MATKLVKASLLKSFSARCYAAQPAAAADSYGVVPPEPLKTTQLDNGVQVASVENQSPLARIAIAVRAGSRYEAADSRGVAHLLRVVAGLSNSEYTVFGMTRRLQQFGGSLTCSADRDILIYSIDATRNNLDEAQQLLAAAVTRQVFKPWEVQECVGRLSLDLQLATPQSLLLELLHRAAFRQSDLGGGLLAPAHALSSLGPDHLTGHLARNLLSGRTVVVGTGVDHGELAKFAASLELPHGHGAARSAQYGGGEVRTDCGGPLALVAVAAEGCGCSAAPATAQAVLAAVLGAGTVTKYGGARGVLGTAAGCGTAAAAALNVMYTDTGLLGYTVTAETAHAGKAVEVVNKAFKTATLTADDVKRGKALVKAGLLRAEDSSACCLESMATQACSVGSVTSPAEAVTAVDAVTLADVQTLHKKLAGGKLSMAAWGNLQHVPYLDQL